MKTEHFGKIVTFTAVGIFDNLHGSCDFQCVHLKSSASVEKRLLLVLRRSECMYCRFCSSFVYDAFNCTVCSVCQLLVLSFCFLFYLKYFHISDIRLILKYITLTTCISKLHQYKFMLKKVLFGSFLFFVPFLSLFPCLKG